MVMTTRILTATAIDELPRQELHRQAILYNLDPTSIQESELRKLLKEQVTKEYEDIKSKVDPLTYKNIAAWDKDIDKLSLNKMRQIAIVYGVDYDLKTRKEEFPNLFIKHLQKLGVESLPVPTNISQQTLPKLQITSGHLDKLFEHPQLNMSMIRSLWKAFKLYDPEMILEPKLVETQDWPQVRLTSDAIHDLFANFEFTKPFLVALGQQFKIPVDANAEDKFIQALDGKILPNEYYQAYQNAINPPLESMDPSKLRAIFNNILNLQVPPELFKSFTSLVNPRHTVRAGSRLILTEAEILDLYEVPEADAILKRDSTLLLFGKQLLKDEITFYKNKPLEGMFEQLTPSGIKNLLDKYYEYTIDAEPVNDANKMLQEILTIMARDHPAEYKALKGKKSSEDQYQIIGNYVNVGTDADPFESLIPDTNTIRANIDIIKSNHMATFVFNKLREKYGAEFQKAIDEFYKEKFAARLESKYYRMINERRQKLIKLAEQYSDFVSKPAPKLSMAAKQALRGLSKHARRGAPITDEERAELAFDEMREYSKKNYAVFASLDNIDDILHMEDVQNTLMSASSDEVQAQAQMARDLLAQEELAERKLQARAAKKKQVQAQVQRKEVQRLAQTQRQAKEAVDIAVKTSIDVNETFVDSKKLAAAYIDYPTLKPQDLTTDIVHRTFKFPFKYRDYILALADDMHITYSDNEYEWKQLYQIFLTRCKDYIAPVHQTTVPKFKVGDQVYIDDLTRYPYFRQQVKDIVIEYIEISGSTYKVMLADMYPKDVSNESCRIMDIQNQNYLVHIGDSDVLYKVHALLLGSDTIKPQTTLYIDRIEKQYKVTQGADLGGVPSIEELPRGTRIKIKPIPQSLLNVDVATMPVNEYRGYIGTISRKMMDDFYMVLLDTGREIVVDKNIFDTIGKDSIPDNRHVGNVEIYVSRLFDSLYNKTLPQNLPIRVKGIVDIPFESGMQQYASMYGYILGPGEKNMYWVFLYDINGIVQIDKNSFDSVNGDGVPDGRYIGDVNALKKYIVDAAKDQYLWDDETQSYKFVPGTESIRGYIREPEYYYNIGFKMYKAQFSVSDETLKQMWESIPDSAKEMFKLIAKDTGVSVDAAFKNDVYINSPIQTWEADANLREAWANMARQEEFYARGFDLYKTEFTLTPDQVSSLWNGLPQDMRDSYSKQAEKLNMKAASLFVNEKYLDIISQTWAAEPATLKTLFAERADKNIQFKLYMEAHVFRAFELFRSKYTHPSDAEIQLLWVDLPIVESVKFETIDAQKNISTSSGILENFIGPKFTFSQSFKQWIISGGALGAWYRLSAADRDELILQAKRLETSEAKTKYTKDAKKVLSNIEKLQCLLSLVNASNADIERVKTDGITIEKFYEMSTSEIMAIFPSVASKYIDLFKLHIGVYIGKEPYDPSKFDIIELPVDLYTHTILKKLPVHVNVRWYHESTTSVWSEPVSAYLDIYERVQLNKKLVYLQDKIQLFSVYANINYSNLEKKFGAIKKNTDSALAKQKMALEKAGRIKEQGQELVTIIDPDTNIAQDMVVSEVEDLIKMITSRLREIDELAESNLAECIKQYGLVNLNAPSIIYKVYDETLFAYSGVDSISGKVSIMQPVDESKAFPISIDARIGYKFSLEVVKWFSVSQVLVNKVEKQVSVQVPPDQFNLALVRMAIENGAPQLKADIKKYVNDGITPVAKSAAAELISRVKAMDYIKANKVAYNNIMATRKLIKRYNFMKMIIDDIRVANPKLVVNDRLVNLPNSTLEDIKAKLQKEYALELQDLNKELDTLEKNKTIQTYIYKPKKRTSIMDTEDIDKYENVEFLDFLEIESLYKPREIKQIDKYIESGNINFFPKYNKEGQYYESVELFGEGANQYHIVIQFVNRKTLVTRVLDGIKGVFVPAPESGPKKQYKPGKIRGTKRVVRTDTDVMLEGEQNIFTSVPADTSVKRGLQVTMDRLPTSATIHFYTNQQWSPPIEVVLQPIKISRDYTSEQLEALAKTFDIDRKLYIKIDQNKFVNELMVATKSADYKVYGDQSAAISSAAARKDLRGLLDLGKRYNVKPPVYVDLATLKKLIDSKLESKFGFVMSISGDVNMDNIFTTWNEELQAYESISTRPADAKGGKLIIRITNLSRGKTGSQVVIPEQDYQEYYPEGEGGGDDESEILRSEQAEYMRQAENENVEVEKIDPEEQQDVDEYYEEYDDYDNENDTEW